jgi:hypothetical protein
VDLIFFNQAIEVSDDTRKIGRDIVLSASAVLNELLACLGKFLDIVRSG